jgi:hypothetical protein
MVVLMVVIVAVVMVSLSFIPEWPPALQIQLGFLWTTLHVIVIVHIQFNGRPLAEHLDLAGLCNGFECCTGVIILDRKRIWVILLEDCLHVAVSAKNFTNTVFREVCLRLHCADSDRRAILPRVMGGSVWG